MKLGMIGLGRMGANMAQRLMQGGHQLVGFDPKPEARKSLEDKGAESADSLAALVAKLSAPRIVWMMVPAGEITDSTLTNLLPLLAAGDIVIDGGNSNYKDTLRRAGTAAEKKIGYVDCGTSGGVWGLAEGYSMMVGGDENTVEQLRPIFETLAPAKDKGWGRVGPVGAGHFTKMIHNGVEYGMMQAYAEGFSILQHKKEFGLDLHQVAEIWRTGSVVRSWLLDLTADALGKNPSMAGIAPYVVDSGEGRWTVAEAIDLNVPAPIITQSLIERLRSRDSESFTDKLLSAMRNEFGGHEIKKE
ncbi:decarboxylating 6-phosphogluconate dehydrogenase [Pseudolysobacter antarcticus]|uniref:Decarboxylating 6-phosphogluconate dehydrogenase n=1 Tax=Pseudolysobacter antarcticus TaxID=2511995 RepID=A0A411HHQ7_9GAMM|nr:decarboxylating 6-phosphogluconate dehydrogenase [Pseudolysobacter antarcticus]QBB70072.1 decarboxylating 6-phosphogluconate dehydrogenase [Pseudolysobacter antarcticus]